MSWSQKMNLIDTSTNSPHYFCWERIGTTWEFKFLILGLKVLSVLFGMQLQETLCAIINISDSFSYELLLVLLRSSFRQCQYNIKFCLLNFTAIFGEACLSNEAYVFIQMRRRFKTFLRVFRLGAFSEKNLYISF